MICPGCCYPKSLVLETRERVYKCRRRECVSCGHRWSTVEVDKADYKAMVKKLELLNSLL